ncbi:MAG: hypothetical protein AAF184_06440 [Pseudomonadota bacterium]
MASSVNSETDTEREGLRAAVAMATRVVLIVAGGYALTGGLSALGGIAMHALGTPLDDAMLLASMVGFLVYVGIVIWGFSAPPHWRPSLVILTLAVITMVAASTLAPSEVLPP